MNEAYFGSPVRGDVKSAIGLDGQRILIWPEHDLVVVVLTQYQHFANQGYVLDLDGDTLNFRIPAPLATGALLLPEI